jgi:hypothetical protein
MKQKPILIIAVISGWLLTAIGVTAALLLESSLPDELQAYLAKQAEIEYTPLEWTLFGISLVIVVLNLASSIGLLFLRSWARMIYTVTLALLNIFMLFDGPTIESGIDGFFHGLSLIVSGFLICLIWFSELAPCFDKHENA